MINCLLEANVQKYIDLLRNSKIFSNTGDSDIVRLLERAEAVHRSYKKGEIILADGTKTEKAGFLLTGSAVISKDDFWGNRNILARITGGSMFAETFALLHDAAVNVNVTAEQDCTVLWLRLGAVAALAGTDRAAGMLSNRIINDLAYKNLRFNEKITHMSRRTTALKLMSYLSAEAAKAGSDEFTIPFDRKGLADYLSVERSAMSAELSKLRAAGMIEYRKNKFRLIKTPEGR